ncbi:MAG TPA: hypothetical protein VG897_15415 [Terriglobales bacterium]|nr:hypothetical protein [Terriglobales bacterium]
MNGNVAVLPVGKRLHPAGVIESARSSNLKRVFIIGWDEDGKFFFSGSESIETTIYMLRNAEHELFQAMERAEAAG